MLNLNLRQVRSPEFSVRGVFSYGRFMENLFLNRVNSRIRVRKERTEAFFTKKQVLLYDQQSFVRKQLRHTSVLSNDP